jgi:hypothetical protein
VLETLSDGSTLCGLVRTQLSSRKLFGTFLRRLSANPVLAGQDMKLEGLRESMLMIVALAVFVLLLVVPQRFFFGAQYWLAALFALTAVVYLMYEYHGAGGFAFVPDLMALCVTVNSAAVFVASTGAIFRSYSVSWWITVPTTVFVVFVAGFVLVKLDPLVRRLYRAVHGSSTSSAIAKRRD